MAKYEILKAVEYDKLSADMKKKYPNVQARPPHPLQRDAVWRHRVHAP
jgi:hypothetical protein